MNRYRFGMVVTGTASVTVEAENQEEAIQKLEDGEWSCEEESQETEWNLPDCQDLSSAILDIEYIK